MIDYARIMGVERLRAMTNSGEGVSIAILDSGKGGICEYTYGYTYDSGCVFECSQCPISKLDDKFGHATAVSSILFGGKGVLGLCAKAMPYYIKVLDDSGVGNIRSVADGINKAVDLDVDVINLSLGFPRTEKCPEDIERACDRAYRAGKIIICAAGNDGGAVNWPGGLKTTICVGSAVRSRKNGQNGQNGQKSSFSSFGEVDFVVPGENLPVLDKNEQIQCVSGTSFASAIVSGVVVLIVAKFKQKKRKISVKSVLNELKSMSIDIGTPGWDENTGFGLIFGENTSFNTKNLV